MNFKKITAAVSALAMSAGIASYLPGKVPTVPVASVTAADVEVNYGEALQKSMFFYEVQQAGELPDWNMVSWRADSMLTDVVQGGWFDAGDHFKFTLTNAYTANVLAWGLIEYRDAVKKAGLYDLYLKNLKWGLDYVMACDKGDKVISTIGHPKMDHVWWGSAEVYERKMKLQYDTEVRPYDETTSTTTVADMASALAAGYIVFKDEDPALAKQYLEHAESLFKLADTTRDNDGQGVQKEYYNTQHDNAVTDYIDELFYAANWMYMATGDKSYLDKCETDYIPYYPLENQSTERKFTWGFCWDDTSQAAALLYAINTGKQEWIDHVAKHLDFWSTGVEQEWGGSKKVDYTPDGLAFLTNWGATRHVSNTAFLAKLASDTIFKDDSALADKYNNWAKGQLDYIFGDNDLGLCYVLGMGEKNANTWHHRTSSGVWDDKWGGLGTTGQEDSKEYAHVLYGALEGGPSKDGTFNDKVSAYENTEVAIDYNAGYTALLCAMIDDYGGTPLADFPPTETPKWNEFFMRASINQSGDSYTEIKAYAMNHSAWPTRVIKDLSYNYYFDISELVEQGASISDVQVKIGNDQHQGDEGKISISEPVQYEGNIYYVKLSFNDGRVVMPTGQSEHRSECQFRIGIPDNLKNAANEKITWNAANDYSFKDLVQGGETDMIDTPYITMYDGDTLIWGTEPDGTTAKPYDPDQPTENPSDLKVTLWGDANVDQKVDIADAVLIMQSLANPDVYGINGTDKTHITHQGELNADVYNNGDGITNSDALAIQKYRLKLVTELPES